MEDPEIKITFTGAKGSGKTALLLIAAAVFKVLGHEVTLAHTYLPCSMKVTVNEEVPVYKSERLFRAVCFADKSLDRVIQELRNEQ